MRTPEIFDVALAEAKEEVTYGIGAGKTLDAQQGVRGFVCPKPVSVSQAAVSGHHRDHEGRKSLDRWDGVGAGAGAWHQPADPSGKPDPLEEGDETDQTAEGRDGFRGGSEPDCRLRKMGLQEFHIVW